MRRLTCIIILVAFVFSCGGNWGVLQGLAWANMIREYSHMVPMAQAMKMTFSGDYPCPLCKAIAEKKNSEQQKATALEKYDKKFPLPAEVALATLKICPIKYPGLSIFSLSRSETPPTPPPRLA